MCISDVVEKLGRSLELPEEFDLRKPKEVTIVSVLIRLPSSDKPREMSASRVALVSLHEKCPI